MAASPTLKERFWDKVIITDDPWDCWDWSGATNPDGYGNIYVGDKRTDKAHRVSFSLSRGRPVQAGLEVMHLCDRPPCVNPVHLEEATHLQNMMDSWEKGRLNTVIRTPEMMEKMRQNTPRGDRHHMKKNFPRYQGELNGNSKLTAEQVKEIRRLREEEGLTLMVLAERFSVNHTMIGFIVRGEVWLEPGQKRPAIVRQKRTPPAPKVLTMPQKGHGGETNGNRKLNWENVREIRSLFAAGGITQTALALRFGVWSPTISMIIRNRTWVESEDPPPAA